MEKQVLPLNYLQYICLSFCFFIKFYLYYYYYY